MRENLKAHIAYQRLTAIQELGKVPDQHRASHFLDGEMRSAERKARDLSRFKTGDDSLNKRLAVGRKRVDSLARTFETLAASIQHGAPLPVVRRARMPGAGSMRTV